MRHHPENPELAILRLLWCFLHRCVKRHPHLELSAGISEVQRHHADNCVELVVQLEALAQHCWIGRKVARPVVMTYYGDQCAVLICSKRATQRCPTEQRKELRRNGSSQYLLCVVLARNGVLIGSPQRSIIKSADALADVAIVRNRRTERHQALSIVVRKRAQ